MSYRKIALGVLVLALAGVLAWAVANRLSSSGDSAATGKTVSYTGETLDGESLSLSIYSGKPVVLNFWATWCGYCVQETPELVQFAHAHPDVTVIGVNVNDERSAAASFASEKGMDFPVIYDPNGRFFNQFASQGLPTTVFLNKDLEVTDKIVGATDVAGFERGLESTH